MKLTKAQHRALTILKDTTRYQGSSATTFAQKMWPDSNMHTKVYNRGIGAVRGKGAWLCGGSYLSKLAILGLVFNSFSHGYYISREGLEELKSVENNLN